LYSVENNFKIIHLHYSNLDINGNDNFYSLIKKIWADRFKETKLKEIFSFENNSKSSNEYIDRFAYHRAFKEKFKALKSVDENGSTVFFENGIILVISSYEVKGRIEQVTETEKKLYDESEHQAISKFDEIRNALPQTERYKGIDHHRIIILLSAEEKKSLTLTEISRLISGKSKEPKKQIIKNYIKDISRWNEENLILHWRADFIKHQKFICEQIINLIIFSRLLKYELKILDSELSRLINRSVETVEKLRKSKSIYWSPADFKRLIWEISEKKIYLIDRLEYLDNYSKAFQSDYFISAIKEMEKVYRITDWKKSIDKKIQYLNEFLQFFDETVTEITDKFTKVIGLVLTILASIISVLLAIQVGGVIAAISLVIMLGLILVIFILREYTVFSWKPPKNE